MTNSEKIPWKRLTAEGLAIVVSILLAFWIDAWWEGHEQKQQLIGNLQALEAEIEFNHRLINTDLEYIAGIFEAMDSVFRALVDQEASALPDEFLIDVGTSYTIRAIEVTNSAYDVVVSPENLRLIRNAELRSSLIEARQGILEISTSRNILWSEYTERQGPFLASTGLVGSFGWLERQEKLVQSGMLQPLPDAPFARDLSPLLTRDYWYLLEHWRVIYFDYVYVVIRARREQERALELLRSELAVLTGAPSGQPDD